MCTQYRACTHTEDIPSSLTAFLSELFQHSAPRTPYHPGSIPAARCARHPERPSSSHRRSLALEKPHHKEPGEGVVESRPS